MKGNFEENASPDQDLHSDATLSRDFDNQLNLSNDSFDFCEEEEKTERDDDEEEAEEEEFSFFSVEDCTSPIAAEDAFINGQIKPVFPLFNRDLLISSEEPENLPMKPPVNKIFVETIDSPEVTSSASGDNEIAGPFCQWSNRKAVEVSPEACKKSNSTGFSKIWRFKEFMGRSNSDGRDAFVFLNTGHAPPAAEVNAEKKVLAVKVKKGGRGKTAPLSAHEVYLRSKAKEEEKRRSYLPYRPELMGFFTTVNSGLSKNVHPF